MRPAAILFAIVALIGSAALSALAARTAVIALEDRAVQRISAALGEDETWAKISADGLIINVAGEAPNADAQLRLFDLISSVAPRAKLVDETRFAPAAGGVAVEFRLEILRSPEQITLLGTVPGSAAASPVPAEIAALTSPEALADLRRFRPFAAPEGWDESLALGIRAAGLLEQAQITVTPGAVELRGAAASQAERAEVLAALEAERPAQVALTADLSAPRPVIAPFAFAARLDAGAALVVERCAAETEPARERILALTAEMGSDTQCDLGIGAPTPEWDGAVTAALAALGRLGAGALEIEDADIRLTGPAGGDQSAFDAEIAALTGELPEVFSLHGVLPPAPAAPQPADAPRPPRFTAERLADGGVRIGGDLRDDTLRRAAERFAEAQFGFDTVENRTATRGDLPAGWSAHVVTGLEALGFLRTGALEITDTSFAVSGVATSSRVEEELRRMLGARLPARMALSLDLEIAAEPAGADAPPPAALCAERIAARLEADQVVFPPGQTAISEQSLPAIGEIADILNSCPAARFEVAGHTDSQGDEGANLALSQARAEAVLAEILAQGVDTVFLYARGYGEADPIASNQTEEGRARNRRITFRLLEAVAADAGAEEEFDPDAEVLPRATNRRERRPLARPAAPAGE